MTRQMGQGRSPDRYDSDVTLSVHTHSIPRLLHEQGANPDRFVYVRIADNGGTDRLAWEDKLRDGGLDFDDVAMTFRSL